MYRNAIGALAALCLLAPASQASAITIKIASQGVVAFGQDGTGMFGAAGAYLTGQAYSFVAVFDLSNAGYFTNGVRSDLFGGEAYSYLPVTPPSMGGGAITINGHTQVVNGQWNSWLLAYSGGGSSGDTQFVQDYIATPNHSLNNAIQMHEEPSFGLFTANYVPPTGNLCVGEWCGGSSFAFNESVNGNVVAQAYGNLDPRFITITTLSAAPEPSAWALMILGFGATGFRLRRRAPGPVPA